MTLKDPIERKRVSVLNLTLVGILALLPLGGYLVNGIDFAKATLVGCLVVAINFFVSQRLLGRVIRERTIPIALLMLYLGKLGISALIIYYAIKYRMDPWGLMIGLSSIFWATIISSLMRGKSTPKKNKKVESNNFR